MIDNREQYVLQGAVPRRMENNLTTNAPTFDTSVPPPPLTSAPTNQATQIPPEVRSAVNLALAQDHEQYRMSLKDDIGNELMQLVRDQIIDFMK